METPEVLPVTSRMMTFLGLGGSQPEVLHLPRSQEVFGIPKYAPNFRLDRSKSRWTRVGIPWQRGGTKNRHHKWSNPTPTQLAPSSKSDMCWKPDEPLSWLDNNSWNCKHLEKPWVLLPVLSNVQWSMLIYQLQGSCNGQVSRVVDPATKNHAQHKTWARAKVARQNLANQITPFNSPSTFSKMFSPHVSGNLCMKIVMWSIAGWMSVHSASILTGSDRDENMTGLRKEMMTYPSQSNSMNKS